MKSLHDPLLRPWRAGLGDSGPLNARRVPAVFGQRLLGRIVTSYLYIIAIRNVILDKPRVVCVQAGRRMVESLLGLRLFILACGGLRRLKEPVYRFVKCQRVKAGRAIALRFGLLLLFGHSNRPIVRYHPPVVFSCRTSAIATSALPLGHQWLRAEPVQATPTCPVWAAQRSGVPHCS